MFRVSLSSLKTGFCPPVQFRGMSIVLRESLLAPMIIVAVQTYSHGRNNNPTIVTASGPAERENSKSAIIAMQSQVSLCALCLASLVALSSQLPSAPSCSLGLRRNLVPSGLTQRSATNTHAPLRIRGGGDSDEEKEEEKAKVSLLDELKNNVSWNP